MRFIGEAGVNAEHGFQEVVGLGLTINDFSDLDVVATHGKLPNFVPELGG